MSLHRFRFFSKLEYPQSGQFGGTRLFRHLGLFCVKVRNFTALTTRT